MSKTLRHFLMAVQSPTPALEEEGPPATFRRGDCVLVTDDIQICIVRIENISLLEACRNFTLVHLPERKLLIRRGLKECERKLDSSIFFRASRHCIVNLSQVKQPTRERRRPHFRYEGRKRSCAFSQANHSLPDDTKFVKSHFGTECQRSSVSRFCSHALDSKNDTGVI
jgi:DNA-binding LytR/AlgR family response regulator